MWHWLVLMQGSTDTEAWTPEQGLLHPPGRSVCQAMLELCKLKNLGGHFHLALGGALTVSEGWKPPAASRKVLANPVESRSQQIVPPQWCLPAPEGSLGGPLPLPHMPVRPGV